MAEPEELNHGGKPSGKGGIRRRVGPLPLWGWGLVGAAGLTAIVLLLRRRGGTASGEDVSMQPEFVGGGGGGGYYPPGSVVVGGGGSATPTTPTTPINNPNDHGSEVRPDPPSVCIPSGLPAWMEWPCSNQIPYWLKSGGSGAPKGYKIKQQYVNYGSGAPSYDPRDPDVYMPLVGTGAPSSGMTYDYTVQGGPDMSPGMDVLTTDGMDLLGAAAVDLREKSRQSWHLVGADGRWIPRPL